MKVEFLGSYWDDFPESGVKDVIFVGRSNVGKSSLINMLVEKNVAKVSKEPGRTRCVNIYLIDNSVQVVDVPGYGFAKVSKVERERWKFMLEKYFVKRRESIKSVLLLVDSVVGPTQLDMNMIEWLNFLEVPFNVVLTRVDRANQREISKTLRELRRLGIEHTILSSAKEGKGKKELIKIIFG
ncbi:MAG: ribosome biogenesis GTP-binding protein YihA/YsxC [Aquificaceae bacterium]